VTRLRARTSAAHLKAVVSAASAAVAFVICLAPQLLAYRALNGRYSPSPLVARKMAWSSPHALQVLFSPEHGLFFWTPLALVSLAGLVILAVSRARFAGSEYDRGERRQIAAALLAMAVATIYVTGSVESWTAAGAFGQRRFVALTPVLVVGLAALFPHDSPRRVAARRGLGILVALCVWWNVVLITQFGAHLMDRQRLELARNARTAFVTLPAAAPRLIYRYLFDRQSFYEPEPPGSAR
jgi:hypothetical protein